ncbi:hypothetical protein [Thauera sinica]|uniref:hypothetical protein n=1 Tax=Thauera sinica TaxID=2665146 RepID=UPI000BBAA86A|nr:hypothetical protein CCZ27_03265 [Thauera sp. K11]
MCTLEWALHLDARRPTLEQVRLEATDELFVIAALFLEVEIVPLVKIAQVEPLHQRVGILPHSLWRILPARHVSQHFEE